MRQVARLKHEVRQEGAAGEDRPGCGKEPQRGQGREMSQRKRLAEQACVCARKNGAPDKRASFTLMVSQG